MVIHPKINLGLRVLGRRPDGFHDIETLFVPYEGLSDRLEIEPSSELSVEFSGSIVPDWDPMKDITVKAWRMLEEDFGIGPVRIRLEKGIPAGGGLGGGSADAVGALRLLNELFGLGLDEAQLLSYAAHLGSDCPFFVKGVPCIGEGRGEILTPFDIDLSAYGIRLVNPGIKVNTAAAYASIDTLRQGPPTDAQPLRDILRLPVPEWRDRLVNDFEAPVFAEHPEIAAVKQRFYDDGAVYAAMSGSGSSVFAVFRNWIIH